MGWGGGMDILVSAVCNVYVGMQMLKSKLTPELDRTAPGQQQDPILFTAR